jgi:osmotically inducible lipoprotein OsmB
MRASMSLRLAAALTASAFALSGCLETSAERGLAGAAGGAVVGNALGVNPITGAAIGGAAGYFCDQVKNGPCTPRG